MTNRLITLISFHPRAPKRADVIRLHTGRADDGLLDRMSRYNIAAILSNIISASYTTIHIARVSIHIEQTNTSRTRHFMIYSDSTSQYYRGVREYIIYEGIHRTER